VLKYSETTVFNVDAQTMVNTVNCRGVMGTGFALEFKIGFPEMYADYVSQTVRTRRDTDRGALHLSRLWQAIDLQFPNKAALVKALAIPVDRNGIDLLLRHL